MEIIPDLLKHGCKMAPKNIAIEYNDKHLTYSDLSNEVNLVKDYLLNKGVKPGDRVALCLSNSHLFVSLFFALSDIGAIAVPLNISYKQEEINKYCNNARQYYLDNFDRNKLLTQIEKTLLSFYSK